MRPRLSFITVLVALLGALGNSCTFDTRGFRSRRKYVVAAEHPPAVPDVCDKRRLLPLGVDVLHHGKLRKP